MAMSFEEYCRDVFDPKKVFSKPEPLKGYRFLSMTQYILGPSAANYLAELGAAVIKIELPPPAARSPQPLIDYSRIDLAELPVADPPSVEGAGAVVLRHPVRLGRQHLHDLLPLGLMEIDREEILVVICAEEP